MKVRMSVPSAEAYAGFPVTSKVLIDTPGTIRADTSPRLVPRIPLQGEPRLRRQGTRPHQTKPELRVHEALVSPGEQWSPVLLSGATAELPGSERSFAEP
jgi:hypothetical protein